MNILVCGDTHSNEVNIELLCIEAVAKNIKLIIVVGDFGYFPNTSWGQKFLEDLKRIYEIYKVEIHFIKGNHENHDALNELPIVDGVAKVMDGVYYHPNMIPFTIGDYSFVAVGGANSIDKMYRKQYIDWFPNEMITMDDYYKSCSMAPCDIVLSHDAPVGVVLTDYLDWMVPSYDTTQHRLLLQNIVNNLKPKLLVHGHWHVRYKDIAYGESNTNVIGLHCDAMRTKQTFELDTKKDLAIQFEQFKP
jgi:predicted phosphodiesterase